MKTATVNIESKTNKLGCISAFSLIPLTDEHSENGIANYFEKLVRANFRFGRM